MIRETPITLLRYLRNAWTKSYGYIKEGRLKSIKQTDRNKTSNSLQVVRAAITRLNPGINYIGGHTYELRLEVNDIGLKLHNYVRSVKNCQ